MSDRIQWIDTVRGITIISMILYHFTWDLVYIFHMDIPWMDSFYAYCWQQSICWSFILLSGFCWSLGHHPLKNGIQTFCFGALITVVTVIFLPEESIIFGILTFLGTSMLLLYILDPLLRKWNPYCAMILFFLLFVFTKGIKNHHLGWGIFSIGVPDYFYRNYFTSFLGMHFKGFYSVDYFGLFPWLFLYITGYYMHKIYLVFKDQNRKEICGSTGKIPLLSFLGKHSIWVYMIHLPLLYVILTLWQQITQA